MLSRIPHYPLLSCNTFGMDVYAAAYSEITEEADLLQLEGPDGSHDLFILGGGSNILFTKDVPQWVLHNKIKGIRLLREDEAYIWLEAGAGEIWHELVRYCVDKGYGGVENLSLIPGTVGAAPIQNIGAYGAELKDVLDSVRFFNLEKKAFETYSNEQCAFGYRDSIFKGPLKGKIVITSVVFRLDKKPVFNTSYGNIKEELEAMGSPEPTIRAMSDAVIRIRTAKLPDPKVTGNAGSFFKNPEVADAFYAKLRDQYPLIPGYPLSGGMTKIPAGWLIEQCGWKGFREADYGVHRNQALVLVNYGKARGADIARLSERIMASVEERFGILLEREVQIV